MLASDDDGGSPTNNIEHSCQVWESENRDRFGAFPEIGRPRPFCDHTH